MLGWQPAPGPGPPTDLQTVSVGQITAIARPGDVDLAVSLAERADQPTRWYGLGRRSVGRVVLMVVRGPEAFRAVSRGRVPGWGAGLALPAARFIAIRADRDDPFRVLRHELAHLILHDAIQGRVPLWFDEGYAVVAAGEFGRLTEFGLNFVVATGQVPGLEALNAGLRGGESTAEASYALAGSAVAFLDQRAGGIEPLLRKLVDGVSFDTAVAITTGMNPGRFEETWQRDVKRHYGLGLWLMAGGIWVLVAGLVLVAHAVRKRRDIPRREALNRGWIVPPDDPLPVEPAEGAPEPANPPSDA